MTAMRAKFGLSLSTRSVLFGYATMDDLLDSARRAEESGLFHGVWVGDNLLGKPRVEAIVTLSALAARTERVKLGTICMASFPTRHPLPLAIQLASLDVLSKGRTIFGVCSGVSGKAGGPYAQELEVMGVKSGERVSRLVEQIQLLRRLWTEERVTFEGKYHRFADLQLLPKPVQQPPPIYIAVNPNQGQDEVVVERILRRVARHADGWQVDVSTPQDFGRRFATIREYAAQEGRDPARLESSVHLMVNIDEDREQAFAESEEYFAHYYRRGTISRERAELWVACGPPDAVIDRIQAFLNAGCTLPVLRFTSRDARAQLERCIQEVLPAFRAN